ncbi:MAG: hypothetical protein R3B09_08770 [Nannocystaceae bacterium]
MTRHHNAYRVTSHVALALALCRCAASEPVEAVEPPELAPVFYAVDLGRSQIIVVLTPLGLTFTAPDGERLTPLQVDAYAGAPRDWGDEGALPVRMVVDRAVPVDALLRVMFETMGGRDGFAAEFVVQEGAKTGALRLQVYGALGDLADEHGCAHIDLHVDGAEVVVKVLDTTIRRKEKAKHFRDVEFSQLRHLVRDAGVDRSSESPGEAFTLTEWDEGQYAALLDAIVAAALAGSTPCSEATVFIPPDLRWGRLALLLGGLLESGVEAVSLFPIHAASIDHGP